MRAQLTPHARERAGQMGIPTKCVKRLVDGRTPGIEFADIKYCGGRKHLRGPEFTAVYVEHGDVRIVVTVLFNEPFVRQEESSDGTA